MLLTTTALLPTPLAAQVAPPSTSVTGQRVFTPEDFARFAPRTAHDMLLRVPGFVIREAEEERGLGQATGNVLINGQRPSGKSNDASTELTRIPATSVVRIEIVDAATLNIAGLSGQVANIVVKAKGVSGQYRWRPEFRTHVTDPLVTRVDASVTGAMGPVEYTIGIENNSSHSGAGGPTRIFDRNGAPIETREDRWTSNTEQPQLSGRFVIDGPGSSVGNLNLLWRGFYNDYREIGFRSGPGLPDRDRFVRSDEGSYVREIGGDYEFALGTGRLKLIGLDRVDHTPYAQSVITDYADATPDAGSRYVTVGDGKERILRAEYREKHGPSDWQIAVEGAFNSLDNIAELYALRTDGGWEALDLPGGTGRVEEDRYEAVASYGYTLSPKLSLRATLGGEYSRIAQIGGDGLVRTFWRPKGSVSAAWKPSPRLDVNAKLERRVGQLDFGDFLASVNLSSGQEDAGNPNLVPPQSWEAEIEAVQNLGAIGTTTIRLYGQVIDDIIDIVPIGLTAEATGNLDRATRYGVEWKSSINLDVIGWRGARFDTRIQLQDSRVRDPLTGGKRPISNDLMHLVTLALRHDIPASDWAWGGNLSYEKYSLDYRLTEVGRLWEGPVWASVYIEHKNVFGLTVRATAGNILGADSMWQRTVYEARRTGPVAFHERRDRPIGQIFSFSVRGKF